MDIEKIKRSKTTEELLEFSIVNIDKPTGPTSFTVSDFVRKVSNARKTSHFGTLDPMVTGVLPIALNRACKLTGFFLGEDKEYVGIMRVHSDVKMLEIQKIIDGKFLGKIKQTPPVRSRVKRQEREREIKGFKLIEQDGKDILFISDVQGGTYIRKLIDDLGKEENIVGAHMLELRRIRAGIFLEEENKEWNYPSVNLYDFEKAFEEYKNGGVDADKRLREILIPGEVVAELFENVFVKRTSLKKLFTGKPILREDLSKEIKINGERIVVFSDDKIPKLVGIYNVINGEEILAKADFVLQVMK